MVETDQERRDSASQQGAPQSLIEVTFEQEEGEGTMQVSGEDISRQHEWQVQRP